MIILQIPAAIQVGFGKIEPHIPSDPLSRGVFSEFLLISRCTTENIFVPHSNTFVFMVKYHMHRAAKSKLKPPGDCDKISAPEKLNAA